MARVPSVKATLNGATSVRNVWKSNPDFKMGSISKAPKPRVTAAPAQVMGSKSSASWPALTFCSQTTPINMELKSWLPRILYQREESEGAFRGS